MAQVTAVAESTIDAAPERVLEALADYREVRPAILPEQYGDYEVIEGGTGAGTVVSWRLQATKSRVRHVVAEVSVEQTTVTETDRNSSLVTRFEVTAAGTGSKVIATTTWQGATGIGGLFERTFAPLGLRRIHGALLANLAARLAP